MENELKTKMTSNSEGLKISFGVAATGLVLGAALGGLTYANLKDDATQIARAMELEAVRSEDRFDARLGPRFSSDQPPAIRLDDLDTKLRNCLLMQAGDLPSAEISGNKMRQQGKEVSLDIPALRECYVNASVEQVRNAKIGRATVYAALGATGTVLSLVALTGGGLAGAAVNGGLYAYRRRKLAEMNASQP